MKKVIYLFIPVLLMLYCCGKKRDVKSEISNYTPSDTLKIDSLLQKSFNNALLGNIDKGLEFGRKALSLSNKVGWSRGIATAHNDIAANFYMAAKYDAAAVHYYEALYENKRVGNDFGVAVNYSNLGTLFDRVELHNEAIKMYDSAMIGFRKTGHKRKELIACSNAAVSYFMAQKYKFSRIYVDKAIKYFKDDKDTLPYGLLLNTKANLDFIENKFKIAWQTYEQAEKKTGDAGMDFKSTNLMNKGLIILNCEDELLDSLKIQRSQRLDVSWELLSNAEKIATEKSDHSTLMNIYNCKAIWFEKKDDPRSALQEIRKRDAERESIANEAIKRNIISDIVVIYDRINKLKAAEEKEKLEQEKEAHRWWNWITIALAISFSILLLVIANYTFRLPLISKLPFLVIRILGLIGVTLLIEGIAFGFHFGFSEYVIHNPGWVFLGTSMFSVPLLAFHKVLIHRLEKRHDNRIVS